MSNTAEKGGVTDLTLTVWGKLLKYIFSIHLSSRRVVGYVRVCVCVCACPSARLSAGLWGVWGADDRWSSSLSATYLSACPHLHLCHLLMEACFSLCDLTIRRWAWGHRRSEMIGVTCLFSQSSINQSANQFRPLLFDILSQSFYRLVFYRFGFQSVNICARLILSSSVPACSSCLVCSFLSAQGPDVSVVFFQWKPLLRNPVKTGLFAGRPWFSGSYLSSSIS